MCQPVVKEYPEDTVISFFAGLKEARVDVGKKWRNSYSIRNYRSFEDVSSGLCVSTFWTG